MILLLFTSRMLCLEVYLIMISRSTICDVPEVIIFIVLVFSFNEARYYAMSIAKTAIRKQRWAT